ncbi:MAG: protein kinase [Gammaproteobacteria bacterium]|nr:protein kinase [Gammaproteobacteria bacterium]MDH3415654.1 protein kinase [Gammaproteobacteria bacterium]
MQDLKQGTELANRYTLVRKLGAGGAAETWLASDKLTRASVALKILASDRLAPASFRKEWQTSIRLMHAHIVRVFEYHESSEVPFYSLQYVDGPDLSVLSGAPPGHILPAIGLVADALRYAHGKGVVHRDIKAANVLIDRNGAPYLIDFGAAAREGDAADGGSLISASPQSLAGQEPRASDDIFALGGLIYELVSGRSPYSSASTARDIQELVPPMIEAADGSLIPSSVQRLVASMLDKDASQRPDAETVVATLEAAGFAAAPAPASYTGNRLPQGDEVIAISETAHSLPGRAAVSSSVDKDETSGISPRMVGVALAALLAILIGVVFFLPGSVTSNDPELVDAQKQKADESSAKTQRKNQVDFTENVDDLTGRDDRVQARAETEAVLGGLLSKMNTLEKRAVQRWGGLRFRQAQAVYAEGDAAYLARDYDLATQKYQQATTIVEPLLEEVDKIFSKTLSDAQTALEDADTIEALRLFELAVAISPSNSVAQSGYTRAKNLGEVLSLTDRGLAYENELELDAARQSFERAIELDSEWQPAQVGLARVLETINQMEFDSRMTEGLIAVEEGDYPAARAAFRMAQTLMPDSPEPADGLMQVDQGLRLERIAMLERQAGSEEQNEQWELAVETYTRILEIDGNLEFAQQGLRRAEEMSALHARLEGYIEKPDSLSAPSTMRKATGLVVDITRMPRIGPRLAKQRDELSRLLKRAATPLAVELVSDNATDVSIYRIGKLGSFHSREIKLRPGTYVAVGSRAGYRDVRLEFRVSPELESGPVVVRCEETI